MLLAITLTLKLIEFTNWFQFLCYCHNTNTALKSSHRKKDKSSYLLFDGLQQQSSLSNYWREVIRPGVMRGTSWTTIFYFRLKGHTSIVMHTHNGNVHYLTFPWSFHRLQYRLNKYEQYLSEQKPITPITHYIFGHDVKDFLVIQGTSTSCLLM